MTDYISREAAEGIFATSKENWKDYEAAACIAALPAADVRPVVRGRWLKTGGFSDEPIDWVVCDRCKAKIPDFDYSYCPNCGARMEG